MLKVRLIPTLLLKDGRMIKTKQFGEYRDVGNPRTVAKVYDAQKADEDERPMMELPDPRRGPEVDAEIKIDNERLLRILAEQCRDLTKREIDLLALHLQGYTNEEIASAWGPTARRSCCPSAMRAPCPSASTIARASPSAGVVRSAATS